jgi:Protein of unknown function (DUF3040)
MIEPRPVTLTEWERRVLRTMERALADEDPVLAVALRGPRAGDTGRADGASRRRQRRIVWGYVGMAISVLVLGLLVAAPSVQTTGLLMLAAVPVAVHIAVAFPGRPSSRYGRADGDDPQGPDRYR